jgi:hypothetical protein
MTPDQNGDVPEHEVWICTRHGRRFHPFAPRVEDIDIADISHALSNIGRYTGHTSRFYSVAQHSVWVSLIVQPAHALAGLLHDASEAYLVDIPRPMKPHFSKYRQWESRLEECIAGKFGFPYPLPLAVKAADNEMLRHEIAWLFEPGSPLWERWGITERPDPELVPWEPGRAMLMFKERYTELTNRKDGAA